MGSQSTNRDPDGSTGDNEGELREPGQPEPVS